MAFINNTLPPENAQFYEAYEALLTGCRQRGFDLEIHEKIQGDPIFQADLNILRNYLLSIRKDYFDPEKLDLTLEDPFTDPEAIPKFNDEKGFLVMPARYASTGKSVYQEEADITFEEVPLLFEHFEDLAEILNSLRYRTCEYRGTLDIDKSRLNIKIEFLHGASATGERHAPVERPDTRTDTWSIDYEPSYPHGKELICEFYYRLEKGDSAGDWSKVEDVGMNDFRAMVERVLPEIDFDSSEADAWGGICQLQPICIAPEVRVENPGWEDEAKNGVLQVGCLVCEPTANPQTLLQMAMHSLSESRIEYPLAISGGFFKMVQIGHYITAYDYAGGKYGQYNCDTCIEKQVSGKGEDEDGQTAAWRISYVRRPSGALLPFYWEYSGSNPIVGVPFNEQPHRLREDQFPYQAIRFSDGVTQYFSRTGGELVYCEYQSSAETLSSHLPGTGVERRALSNNHYQFKTETIGTALVTVDPDTGLPQIQYSPLGMLQRRASNSVDYDQIKEIVYREGPVSDGGFSVDDFFNAGSTPVRNEVQRSEQVDFYNFQDQVMARYLESFYADGSVARASWSKVDGQLVPAELTAFSQSPVPAEGPGAVLEKVLTVKYGAAGRSEAVSHRLKKNFLFGERTIKEYRRYGQEGQQEAVFIYGEDPGQGNYGKLILSVDFDGGWTRREYDAAGRLVKEIRPFGDAGIGAAESACRVTVYDYALLDENEETFVNDDRARTVIAHVLDVEVAREYRLYFEHETRTVKAAAPGAAWDASGNLIRRDYTYTEGDFTGWPWKTENYDGTSSVTVYEKKNLVVDPDTGNESYDLETTSESGFLPGHGRREVTLKDSAANMISRRVYDIASGLLIEGGDYAYDRYRRQLSATTVDGDRTETEYNCCGPRLVIDPAGTATEYAYDPFGRLKFSSSAGVTTYHAYDANDNEVAVTVTGKNGGELETAYEYDDDGQLIRERDAAGAATLHRRGPGWQETEDALGGVSRTEYYLDGRIKRVSGSAAVPVEYEYGVENGELYTKAKASESEWTKSYTDFPGREYKTVYPDGFAEWSVFDGFGRVVRSENSLGMRSLNVYDEESGKLKYRALKRTVGSGIDFARDQVVGSDSYYESVDGTVFRVNREYLCPDVERMREMTSRDGKIRLSRNDGRETRYTTEYPGDGEVTERTVEFDGVETVQTSLDGLLQQTEHSVLGETTYFYDEFNRSIGSDHPANGVTVSERQTLDAMGRILGSTRSGGDLEQTTTYTCDALGRRLTATTPEGITTTYTYTPRGEVASVSGGVYRQEYAYDAQGRLLSLTTYRDDMTPQETTWEYDDRGRMAKKAYADGTEELTAYRGDGRIGEYTNVRGETLTYSYNLAAELISVTGAGLAMTYDNRGRVAELTDHAGTRQFFYDDYGKVLTETAPQAPSGALMRSYDELQRLTGLRFNGRRVTYLCYFTGSARGIRRITETGSLTQLEFAVGSWENRENLSYQPLNTTFELNEIIYDDFGRPESDPDFGSHYAKPAPYLIESRIASSSAPVSCRYRYGQDGRLASVSDDKGVVDFQYLPDTDLIAAVVRRNGDGAEPFLVTTFEYDEALRLVGIKVNGEPVTTYALNLDNQRTQTTLESGAWDYTYDDLGQLLTAGRGDGNAMAYVYDGIGNRTSAEEDGEATVYVANNLNQYTAVNAEEPAYDADGNILTLDGWNYAWNNESRLIAAEKGDLRVEADYDYLGRRFMKKVYRDGMLIKHQRFVYDGFKLIAVYDALQNDRLEASFMWQPVGMDVPLLMCVNGETFHFVTDGNKNVIALYDREGNQAAAYDYGPFGQLLTAAGPLAATNPFRFSSEYHDDETGLVYYNYRYYHPRLGRWLSRDPIGEKGGELLYGMVGNSPINWWDDLGLYITVDPGAVGYNPFRDSRTGRFVSYNEFVRQARAYGASITPNADLFAFWASVVTKFLVDKAISIGYLIASSALINAYQRLLHNKTVETYCRANDDFRRRSNTDSVTGRIDTNHTIGNDSIKTHVMNLINPGVPVDVTSFEAFELRFFVDCKCKKFRYHGVPFIEATVAIEGYSAKQRKYDWKNITRVEESDDPNVIDACCNVK